MNLKIMANGTIKKLTNIGLLQGKKIMKRFLLCAVGVLQFLKCFSIKIVREIIFSEILKTLSKTG